MTPTELLNFMESSFELECQLCGHREKAIAQIEQFALEQFVTDGWVIVDKEVRCSKCAGKEG